MKIALTANTGWYLYNFRRNLMLTLRELGHEVIVVSPPDDYTRRLVEDGFSHVSWSVTGAGKNPWSELRAVFALRRILASRSVDLVLSYTPKGNIYSGLACLGSQRITLPNISGLGRIFTAGGWLAALVKALYRLSLRRAFKVFFQNEEDRDLFVAAGILSRVKTVRLMGSGVDLSRFVASLLPSTSIQSEEGGNVVFILVARLIWEKGIAQYVEAARILRARRPGTRFQILGALPSAGASSVLTEDLLSWQAEGLIEYLGTTDDVPEVLRQVDCMVLPSYYREGVPRSLIEGAAMGRPCITTDMPGCRDVVEPGVTGWLCAPRDVPSLVDQLQAFIDLSPLARQDMGDRARQRAVRVFDERAVIGHYLTAIESLAHVGARGEKHYGRGKGSTPKRASSP